MSCECLIIKTALRRDSSILINTVTLKIYERHSDPTSLQHATWCFCSSSEQALSTIFFKVLKQDIKWYGQTWTQHKLKNLHENAVTKHWDEMSGIGLGLGLCFQGHLKVRLWAQQMRDPSRGASGDSFHGYCKGVQVTAMAASCSPLKDQSVHRSRRDYMALGIFRNSGTEDNILSNYLCLVYENSKHFTS